MVTHYAQELARGGSIVAYVKARWLSYLPLTGKEAASEIRYCKEALAEAEVELVRYQTMSDETAALERNRRIATLEAERVKGRAACEAAIARLTVAATELGALRFEGVAPNVVASFLDDLNSELESERASLKWWSDDRWSVESGSLEEWRQTHIRNAEEECIVQRDRLVRHTACAEESQRATVALYKALGLSAEEALRDWENWPNRR